VTDRPPAVVVDDILAQFFAQLAKYQLFIEEFTLVPMLEIFRDALPHVAWQLAVGHVLLHLFDLLAILAPAGVQALDEIGRVTEEQCVTGGPGYHR